MVLLLSGWPGTGPTCGRTATRTPRTSQAAETTTSSGMSPVSCEPLKYSSLKYIFYSSAVYQGEGGSAFDLLLKGRWDFN